MPESKLHRNILISLLQLPLWLLFQPSGWIQYIQKELGLSPTFALIELSKLPKNKKSFYQLILIGHLIYPFLTGILTTLIFYFGTGLDKNAVFFIIFGLVTTIMTSIFVSLIVSVAGGISCNIIFALFYNPIVILLQGYDIQYYDDGRLKIVVSNALNFTLCLTLIFSLAAAYISQIMINITKKSLVSTQTSREKFFGIGILLFGALIISLTYDQVLGDIIRGSRPLSLSNMTLGTLLYSLLIGIPIFLGTSNWKKTVLYSVSTIMSSIVIASLSYFYSWKISDNFFGVPFFAITVGITSSQIFFILYNIIYALASKIMGVQVGSITTSFFISFATSIFYVIFGVDLWNTPQLWSVLSINLLAGVIATLVILSSNWWRPLLFYPFQLLYGEIIYQINRQSLFIGRFLLFWQPAFWDEYQYLPLYGLEKHLVLANSYDPVKTNLAIRHLYQKGKQSWAAREAQIELDAMRLEQCQDVNEIGQIHRLLSYITFEGSANELLTAFNNISRDVATASLQSSHFTRRLRFGEVFDELKSLSAALLRSTNRYAERFQPIADRWFEIIMLHQEALHKESEIDQEIDNPYIIGMPLRNQELFVGREELSRAIEESLRDKNHPPLLVYGQRRMGKTSLFYNLRWLLPQQMLPLLVDLQGPVSNARSSERFIFNIAKQIIASADSQSIVLPKCQFESLIQDPFTKFDDWLYAIEEAAKMQGKLTLLLLLDEFEALDGALTRGHLNADEILGTFRHIIQHRKNIKLLLAGSHSVDEFTRWSSFFINAHIIRINYLQQHEARQLIAHPISKFPLKYDEEAADRIHEMTRNHPYLVQLLCYNVVRFKNNQETDKRYWVSVSDIELVIDETLQTGRQFFEDIVRQCGEHGSAVLFYLSKFGRQSVPFILLAEHFHDQDQLHVTLQLVLKREVLECVESDHYRFQIELVRLWFERRATIQQQSNGI